MLYEIKNARKFDNDKRLRWFTNKYFDLTIWLEDDTIVSFQLTYDKYSNPHALTWRKEKGFEHEIIDDGEEPGKHKKSPILLPDGEFPKKQIADRFKNDSQEIDQGIASFVHTTLLSYQ